MQLKRVQITNFQSIHDSNEFDVGDVTCLVGKNEAGYDVCGMVRTLKKCDISHRCQFDVKRLVW